MKKKEIIIDGGKMNMRKNMRWRGAGMVSGNNSSRLLIDYKAVSPDAYGEILEYIFGENGVGVTHLKLEMGSDINSSSGTEPAVKRYEDETADAARGAGFALAADAKRINPDLSLDMLWWSEPKWVSDSADVYAARYKWYKETLDAAYRTYGLKFDCVSAVQNERAAELEWVKYLSRRLKEEKDCPYDYSAIKIVGGEEVCTWGFADRMLEDRELLDAVDVVNSHYTSRSTAAAMSLAESFGKELWFGEGSPSMTYASGACRFDGAGSGLAGINGALDMANRIIAMYPCGRMTLYEYQPVVSAYYDGVTYCHKQLIGACDPWSGYYTLESGFFVSLHFSQFIKKGWCLVDDACFFDGREGGDGHALVDAVYSCMTAADPETGDYSSVITNTLSEPIEYTVRVSALKKAPANVCVWETKGPCGHGAYDRNYFKHIADITPREENGEYSYTVTVAPCSIVTVSTVFPEKAEYKSPDSAKRELLSLPYSDDFAYSEFPSDFLSKRGNAPLYTTDQGGAFEVERANGKSALVQQITPDIKANEWGATPDPVTTLGDDRWYDYSVSADVTLSPSGDKAENYAGVGLRYLTSCAGCSGYHIRICEDGSWVLMENSEQIARGSMADFDPIAPHRLRISAVGKRISAYIDGVCAAEYLADGSFAGAGRAALYSSYNRNRFEKLLIEPASESYSVSRSDDTDGCFDYEGDWRHDTSCGFINYKRTESSADGGAAVTFSFEGTGFALFGENEGGAVLAISVDGGKAEEFTVKPSFARGVFFARDGLSCGIHRARIEIKSGSLRLDGGESR